MQPQAPDTPPPAANAYDFILNPQKPGAKQPSGLPNGSSRIIRVLIVCIGLLVLLLIFAVLKSLLLKGPDYSGFMTVIEDQQEVIHLATNAGQQQNISTINQNFAATAQLSVSSAQTQLIAYLKSNGQTVNPKTINLKVDSSLDSQLTAAAAATTYDQTFQQIIKSQLSNYYNDISKALNQTSGQKGQNLLTNDAAQARLLYNQLSSPTSQ